MLYYLLLIIVAITFLAFILYAAKRLGVLADEGKENTAPFKRLTYITGITSVGLFFILLNLMPTFQQ